MDKVLTELEQNAKLLVEEELGKLYNWKQVFVLEGVVKLEHKNLPIEIRRHFAPVWGTVKEADYAIFKGILVDIEKVDLVLRYISEKMATEASTAREKELQVVIDGIKALKEIV